MFAFESGSKCLSKQHHVSIKLSLKLQLKFVYNVICHMFNADMTTENYKFLSKFLIRNSRNAPC